MRPFPVKLARLLGDGAGLQVSVLDADNGNNLGMVARREYLVGLQEIANRQGPLHRRLTGLAEQFHRARARDTRQERAIGRRRHNDPVLHQEDVG